MRAGSALPLWQNLRRALPIRNCSAQLIDPGERGSRSRTMGRRGLGRQWSGLSPGLGYGQHEEISQKFAVAPRSSGLEVGEKMESTF